MMNATTLSQSEIVPENYPDAPSGLSTAAAALSAAMVWQRIERYVAHRWSEREATWLVEGPGHWRPSLSPAVIDTVKIWRNDAWEAVEPSPSPFGGFDLPSGFFQIVGTVGGGDPAPEVPADVQEAFRRLAEYFAAKPGRAGASSERVTAGSITVQRSVDPAWLGKAMDNSGAADLLRSYRRVQ